MKMENKKSYYAIIPANIRYDKDLKPNEKLLYGEITALANEKGYCWATNNYFAELYDTAKETVSRWISHLEKKGYITTQLIYRGKEIIERRIYINAIPVDKKVNTYCENTQNPIDDFVNTSIDENIKDNNTSINNTINKSVSPDRPTEIPIIVEKILKNSQSSAFYKDERLLIEETVRTICNDGNIATKLKLGLTNLQIRDRILTLEIKHLDRAIKRYQERKNTVTNTVMYFAKILVESINIAGAEEIKHREDNDDD